MNRKADIEQQRMMKKQKDKERQKWDQDQEK